ncbi:hypothetical protein D3C87_1454810 [compost metagenome]
MTRVVEVEEVTRLGGGDRGLEAGEDVLAGGLLVEDDGHVAGLEALGGKQVGLDVLDVVDATAQVGALKLVVVDAHQEGALGAGDGAHPLDGTVRAVDHRSAGETATDEGARGGNRGQHQGDEVLLHE